MSARPPSFELQAPPRQTRIDWSAVSVLVALLLFFGGMWWHLSGRVDAVMNTLVRISETMGRVDERTQQLTRDIDELKSTFRSRRQPTEEDPNP